MPLNLAATEQAVKNTERLLPTPVQDSLDDGESATRL
jgi:hypothetical protein